MQPLAASPNPRQNPPPAKPPTPPYAERDSPSTSSSSSLSSLFDSIRHGREGRVNMDESRSSIRRESAGSATSWESGAGSSRKNSGESEFHRPRPVTFGSSDSERDPSEIQTPDQGSDLNDYQPFNATSSPASSVTSSAPSKGEITPRAELPQPVWPLTSSSPKKMNRTKMAELEAGTEAKGTMGKASEGGNLSRESSLNRTGSWRKKHASLDTPPTIPQLASGIGKLGLLRNGPPAHPTPEVRTKPSVERIDTRPAGPTAYPSPGTEPRRASETSHLSPSSTHKIVAASSATGCYISAPISPPAHYPIPSSYPSTGPSSQAETPTSSSSSVSSASSHRTGSVKSLPPRPRWAQPPTKTNAVSGRAWSFGEAMERPDIDFDPELFQSETDDWIEIIKGSEGRIAVKSTKGFYDIMVWLPGFQLENITIATRGQKTVHIVADQWDEGDHAQWDIKLGEDANMRSISAKFTGQELRITVSRMPRAPTPPLRANHSVYSMRPGQPTISASSSIATFGHRQPDIQPKELPPAHPPGRQPASSSTNEGTKQDNYH